MNIWVLITNYSVIMANGAVGLARVSKLSLSSSEKDTKNPGGRPCLKNFIFLWQYNFLAQYS